MERWFISEFLIWFSSNDVNIITTSTTTSARMIATPGSPCGAMTASVAYRGKIILSSRGGGIATIDTGLIRRVPRLGVYGGANHLEWWRAGV